MGRNSVSIIIPVFNQADLTKLCLEYLLRVRNSTSFEIIVVDNGSTDHTQAILEQLPQNSIKITNRDNLGFSKACNQGAHAAHGKYLVFLNNDTVPQDFWLDELVKAYESNPGTGIVGSKLFYPDGTIQHAGVVFHLFSGMPYHVYMNCDSMIPCANKQREVNAVTGACFFIPKDLFHDLNGFSEEYLNGMEDMDLCLKVKSEGKKIIYNPRSSLMHFASRTVNRQTHMNNNRQIFIQTWQERIMCDDYSILKQDNMVLGADHRKSEFFFITQLDYNTRLNDVYITAFQHQIAGKSREELRTYADFLHMFPFSKEAMEKILAISKTAGLEEYSGVIDHQLEILSRF